VWVTGAWLYHIFFIIGCLAPRFLRVTAIVNRAAIDMGVQVSVLHVDLRSFRYEPKSGIASSYNS
jgi:hypothetical protein